MAAGAQGGRSVIRHAVGGVAVPLGRIPQVMLDESYNQVARRRPRKLRAVASQRLGLQIVHIGPRRAQSVGPHARAQEMRKRVAIGLAKSVARREDVRV